MIGVIVLGIVFGTILYCELTNPNSRIRCHLWCRKHGLKQGRRREVRLCEFATTSSKGTCGKELFAWARYKRGDVPTEGEFTYIDGRVKAKFPNAELVYMKRTFVPVASPSEPTEVWWEYKWIVFKRKEGEKK